MQATSEKCSYLEELSCKEDSLKENQFCFTKTRTGVKRPRMQIDTFVKVSVQCCHLHWWKTWLCLVILTCILYSFC